MSMFMSSNLCLVVKNNQVAWDKITKECQEGRVLDPFPSPLVPNLWISPLRMVPKKVAGEFCLIHHLSFPKSGSVNDAILDYLCSVKVVKAACKCVDMVLRCQSMIFCLLFTLCMSPH